MNSTDSFSIIHKKARVAREDFDARAMSPAKALRVSLAKTADEALDLALTVSTLEQTVATTKQLLAKLDGQGMLMLLDGAGGARGVAACDCQVVSAIIEKQISGQVRTAEAKPRLFTCTDAAMVAPLLDATLTGFDAQLEAHFPGHCAGNFRFGDKVEDARAMSLLLDSGKFDLFRLTVELEEGAKTGVLMIALPCVAHERKPSDTALPGAPSGPSSLEKQALDATVTLSVVVARISLPVSEICALKPEMYLPIAADSISVSQLVAKPSHIIADVHLGQVDGMRAVRIIMPEVEPLTHTGQVLPANEISEGLPDYPGDAELGPVAPMKESAKVPDKMDMPMSTPDEPDQEKPDIAFDLSVPDVLPEYSMSEES